MGVFGRDMGMVKASRTRLCSFMDIQEQIDGYITSQPELKRTDMQELHQLILRVLPGCRLWFDSGVNAENKTVINPTIGYDSKLSNMLMAKPGIFFESV